MKRPITFALEVVAGLFIAVGGAWLSIKASEKLNGKANADIRTSFAMLRIADALERAYPPIK